MRKSIVVALLVVSGLFFASSAARAEQKLGYIDFAKVFGEYSKTKEYDKVFKEKQDAFESGRDKMVNDIKQFQDKMNLMSDKDKEAKKPELENKIKALQDYDRQNTADLRKEQEEKLKELLKDIDDVVKQYCAKEGYTFVFHDKALAYYDKNLDITDAVVKLVNEKKPAGKK